MLRQIRLAVFFTLLMFAGISPAAGQVQAQDTNWSHPVLVFEGPGKIAWPSIAADGYGQVHAFWVFTPDSSTGLEDRQVYYARLDRPDWQPVDILITAESISSLQAAASNSQVGLLWGGGKYSWADINAPLTARAWSTPQSLVAGYPTAGLTVAPDGSLWMVYGDVSTQAVFARKYNSESGDWGPPLFVANASSNNLAPDAPRIGFSPDNVLHVVWVEYQLPNGWPPVGVFYSRSSDDGQNWSAPIEVASGGYNQPNVIGGEGQNVYMSWLGIAGVGGKYFTQSSDGGHSWSGVTAVLAAGTGGGSSGAPSLVLDSGGTLHILFSNATCVYYASLESTGWTDPDCISRGVPSSHTEQPVMTLGLGNELHVLFWTNDRQLWYMNRNLAVPGTQPLPTPTTVVPTDVPPTPPPTTIPTATHLPPDLGVPMSENLFQQANMWVAIAGIVPTVLLVLIMRLIRWRRR